MTCADCRLVSLCLNVRDLLREMTAVGLPQQRAQILHQSLKVGSPAAASSDAFEACIGCKASVMAVTKVGACPCRAGSNCAEKHVTRSSQLQPDTASSGGSSGRKKRRLHLDLTSPATVDSIKESTSSSDVDLGVEGDCEEEDGHRSLTAATQVCCLLAIASSDLASEHDVARSDGHL